MPNHATHAPFSRYLREYLLLNVNPVTRFLILSDVVWRAGVGLLSPIFPIFVIDRIQDGNELVVGVAATIGLVTKGIFQIPAASIIDRIKGEHDDFWILFVGTIVTLLMPLTYLLAHTPAQLYVIEFITNLCMAFTFPPFMAIFTRHVDKEKEGTAWGLYFTLTDFSSALAAGIGGAVALTLGFPTLIAVSVAVSLGAAAFIWPIRKHMRDAKKA